MKHGSGWVIWEVSSQLGTRKLVSILSPRKSAQDVARYMEQLSVDRWASLREKLACKKSPKNWPYQAMMGTHVNPIHVGHDPFLIGVHSHSIDVVGNQLHFKYRVLDGDPEKYPPTFKESDQSLIVDG